MIKAKKSLGQNFLNDEDILKSIANTIKVNKNDLIVEIGPGMGALTKYLFDLNCYLVCFEIDTSLSKYLDKFNTERSKVVYGDFLKQDVMNILNEYNYENLYVVSNIPYYITSPILTKLQSLNCFKSIVLLVQKEFGERVVATKGKDYNAMSVLIQNNYDAKKVIDVSRYAFVPIPKVDSVVIRLLKSNDEVLDKNYEKFVKDCFKNKRKTLRNNLKGYDYEKINNILKDMGYKDNVRAEEIKKEDYKLIWNNL